MDEDTKTCETCDGCGKVDDRDGLPWSYWQDRPANRRGGRKEKNCPTCDGNGLILDVPSSWPEPKEEKMDVTEHGACEHLLLRQRTPKEGIWHRATSGAFDRRCAFYGEDIKPHTRCDGIGSLLCPMRREQDLCAKLPGYAEARGEMAEIRGGKK